MVLENLDIPMQKEKKKKNLDTDLILFTKTNSKQITHMNVKHTTINLLEDRQTKPR